MATDNSVKDGSSDCVETSGSCEVMVCTDGVTSSVFSVSDGVTISVFSVSDGATISVFSVSDGVTISVFSVSSLGTDVTSDIDNDKDVYELVNEVSKSSNDVIRDGVDPSNEDTDVCVEWSSDVTMFCTEVSDAFMVM